MAVNQPKKKIRILSRGGTDPLSSLYKAYYDYSNPQRMFGDICRQLYESNDEPEVKQQLLEESCRRAVVASTRGHEYLDAAGRILKSVQRSADPEVAHDLECSINLCEEDTEAAEAYYLATNGKMIAGISRHPRAPKVANPFVPEEAPRLTPEEIFTALYGEEGCEYIMGELEAGRTIEEVALEINNEEQSDEPSSHSLVTEDTMDDALHADEDERSEDEIFQAYADEDAAEESEESPEDDAEDADEGDDDSEDDTEPEETPVEVEKAVSDGEEVSADAESPSEESSEEATEDADEGDDSEDDAEPEETPVEVEKAVSGEEEDEEESEESPEDDAEDDAEEATEDADEGDQLRFNEDGRLLCSTCPRVLDGVAYTYGDMYLCEDCFKKIYGNEPDYMLRLSQAKVTFDLVEEPGAPSSEPVEDADEGDDDSEETPVEVEKAVSGEEEDAPKEDPLKVPAAIVESADEVADPGDGSPTEPKRPTRTRRSRGKSKKRKSAKKKRTPSPKVESTSVRNPLATESEQLLRAQEEEENQAPSGLTGLIQQSVQRAKTALHRGDDE